MYGSQHQRVTSDDGASLFSNNNESAFSSSNGTCFGPNISRNDDKASNVISRLDMLDINDIRARDKTH